MSVIAALLLLAVFHFTGLIRAFDLSHPFWHVKATLTGAGIGVVLSVASFWLMGHAYRMVQIATVFMVLAMPMALFATWRAARTFIDSADYEPLAGQVWFLSYHASVALFVTLFATVLACTWKSRRP